MFARGVVSGIYTPKKNIQILLCIKILKCDVHKGSSNSLMLL